MLHQHEYVNEKLHQFELEALARRATMDQPRPKRRPVVGPLVFLAGRTLRRVGDRIEGWAAPAGATPKREPAMDRNSPR